jgi:hypothetical protein
VPINRFGEDWGVSNSGPVRSRRPYGVGSKRARSGVASPDNQQQNVQTFECEQLGWNIRTKPEKFEDFIEDPQYEVTFPIYDNVSFANSIIVTNTKISEAEFVVPRHGTLVSATVIGVDALTANDTNYVTFALVNKGTGAGTTAMLAATDANTTKATGGTGLTAVSGRTLTNHATAANLRVNRGDILLFTATVAGTLANAVTFPAVRLVFNTTPQGLQSVFTAAAGSPGFSLLTGTSGADGVIEVILAATSEGETAGYNWADSVMIPMNKGFLFEANVRIPTAITTNQVAVIGLATAYNATLASTAEYAWFKLNASMAVTFEAKDGTTTTTAQTPPTALTLAAATFYLFRMKAKINLERNCGFVEYWLGDNYLGKITIASATASMLLQPVFYIQKASGTTTPAMDIDWYRVNWDRTGVS